MTINDLPATGMLYPSIGFCNSEQSAELLGYSPSTFAPPEPISHVQAAVESDGPLGKHGDVVRVNGLKAGWGKGSVRHDVGVPVGTSASWQVRLSVEDGGEVHFVGVVSDTLSDWNETPNVTSGWWGCQNDCDFADGKLLGGFEEIFSEGDTVQLTLDR